MIRKVSSILAGGLALLLSCNVQALPVTLSTGESALFNFDLTGAGTAPFTSTSATFIFSGFGLGETLSATVFNELFGVDPTFSLAASGTGGLGIGLSAISGTLDGLFSISLTATAGTFDITSASAFGDDATGASVSVDGELVSVPVPTTLALLGLGLAGIGYGRRKQIQAV